MLAELRKRVIFGDLGGKALSGIEYLTDGGRDADGAPEGGVSRLLDGVLPLPAAPAAPAAGRGGGRFAAGAGGRRRPAVWGRLTFATRDDLLPPPDPARDVLVDRLRRLRERVVRARVRLAVRERGRPAGLENLVGFGFSAARATSAPTSPAEGRPPPASSSSSSAARPATSSAPSWRAPTSASTARASATSA